MRKEKMITRTFTQKCYKVTYYDMLSKELKEVDMFLYDDEKPEKSLKDTEKYLDSALQYTKEAKYAMSVRDFIRHGKVVESEV